MTAPSNYLSQFSEPRRLDVARLILAGADEYRDDVVREAAKFMLLSPDKRPGETWDAEAALSRLRVAEIFAEGRAA